jgi:hypothetical protein
MTASTPAASISCSEHEHTMCDLSGCECYCHLYKPKVRVRVTSILVGIALWLVIAAFVYLIFYAMAIVASS